MNKTEKYNKKLNEIIEPEIKRLEKVEKVAEQILTDLDKIVEIDPCGLDKCHLINTIQRAISSSPNIKIV